MNTTAPPLELHALEKLREEELEEARAIQSVMRPAESLRAGAVMISHEFQPVAAVGGDFLDYFQLTDGSVGLYLGDVSGKGLPAALAVGTLRGVHKTGTSPHDVLATLNRRLMIRGMPRRNTAIQYAVFNPHSHELQIDRTANCQRRHAWAISSLRKRLPQPETLRDPPGLIRLGELRDADPAIAGR